MWWVATTFRNELDDNCEVGKGWIWRNRMESIGFTIVKREGYKIEYRK